MPWRVSSPESPARGTHAAHAARAARVAHEGDLRLARACARGDEPAWNEFHARFHDRLHARARALTHDAAQAADLADSLWAELYGLRQRDGARLSKLDSYTGAGSLEGWLCALLARAHVDHWRREHRGVSLDDALETNPALLQKMASPPNQDVTGSAAVRLSLKRAVEHAMRSASGPQRLLLSLYFLDGLTLAEIAQILHVHESTVCRRLDKVLALTRQRTRRALGAAAAQALREDPRWLDVDVRGSLAGGSLAGGSLAGRNGRG